MDTLIFAFVAVSICALGAFVVLGLVALVLLARLGEPDDGVGD